MNPLPPPKLIPPKIKSNSKSLGHDSPFYDWTFKINKKINKIVQQQNDTTCMRNIFFEV